MVNLWLSTLAKNHDESLRFLNFCPVLRFLQTGNTSILTSRKIRVIYIRAGFNGRRWLNSMKTRKMLRGQHKLLCMIRWISLYKDLSANTFTINSNYNTLSQSVQDNSKKWKSQGNQEYHDGAQQQQQPVQKPALGTWMSLPTQRPARSPRPLSSIWLPTNIVSPSLHVLSTQVHWRVTNRLRNINASRNITRRIHRCLICYRCCLGSSGRCAMGWPKVCASGGIAADGCFVLGCCFFNFVRSSCVLAIIWRSDQRDSGHNSNYERGECQGEEVSFASFFDIAYWLYSDQVCHEDPNQRSLFLMSHQLRIECTVMGGWLSNPVETYPNIFGGPSTARWFVKYPYALPI